MLENVKELSPCVFVLDNAIENTEEIIKKAFEKSEKDGISDAMVTDGISNNLVNKEIRDTKMIEISPTFKNDVFWWELSQKLWRYGDFYGKKYDIGFSTMESPQFLFYKKGSGFYDAHKDNDITVPRIFSLVLYLNDVEEGGETHFEYFNLSVRPKAGRILMFPSDFSYLHGARIPISDDKNVIVTWFNP